MDRSITKHIFMNSVRSAILGALYKRFPMLLDKDRLHEELDIEPKPSKGELIAELNQIRADSILLDYGSTTDGTIGWILRIRAKRVFDEKVSEGALKMFEGLRDVVPEEMSDSSKKDAILLSRLRESIDNGDWVGAEESLDDLVSATPNIATRRPLSQTNTVLALRCIEQLVSLAENSTKEEN